MKVSMYFRSAVSVSEINFLGHYALIFLFFDLLYIFLTKIVIFVKSLIDFCSHFRCAGVYSRLIIAIQTVQWIKFVSI